MHSNVDRDCKWTIEEKPEASIFPSQTNKPKQNHPFSMAFPNSILKMNNFEDVFSRKDPTYECHQVKFFIFENGIRLGESVSQLLIAIRKKPRPLENDFQSRAKGIWTAVKRCENTTHDPTSSFVRHPCPVF
ncbi:hypothetical protein TNCT_616251 [Trichonephila clavata]|uniref:Uncharacterized protein n=1 Tax=Trichonephila clavata TaxID=2740835 RepID=A0A8X6KA47_TRICU|nr:hypothetical protein TNCT_616251 [Trichonephila clavata]